ncbi:unnamed protein product [Dicrocoelium dendriticum]|nr:unnamed protein product [Dicrocoelium dendriticum]
MIVFGSGGHTAEMLPFVDALTSRYSPLVCIVASSDYMSEDKVSTLLQSKHLEYTIERIPRPREVKQALSTAIFSFLYSCMLTIPIVLRHSPELVLCNGPGTCLPICFVAYIFHLIFGHKLVVAYVESVCRTKTLSLTGKILYHCRFADIIVQWPELRDIYPRSNYLGLLS